MWAVFRRNPLALLAAVLLHVALAVFLFFEIDWREPVKPIGGDVKVVQAELVDIRELQAADERREAEARAVAEQAALAQRQVEEKRQREALEAQRRQRQAEQAQQQAEEKKAAEAEKQRQIELQRKNAEEAKRKEQEKRRQAELAQQREAEEQKRKEAEARATAEKARQEREAREKAEAERKRKAEQERKRNAEAERKRKAEARAKADREAREAELAAQFAAEQDASEMSRVVGLIQARIEGNWLRPPGSEGLKCTVRVRLGTNGSVLLVDVTESSGNTAFDRSVEAAVQKADPLPMPKSERLRARFRDLTFIFDPGS